ncbi:MAG TPA: BON domain-containing protein [Noviherbaspirillum sp.]|nr:BON domain-containing protein [Noviherbaspirillum sp.]
MNFMVSMSKTVAATALLSLVIAGCDRSTPDQASGGVAAIPETSGMSGTAANDRTGTSSSGASASTFQDVSSSAAKAIDDSVITTKVKTALLADADVKGMDISVNTTQGEVMLNGLVTSQTQIDKAIQVAQAVEGVKKVDNKMTVKQ